MLKLRKLRSTVLRDIVASATEGEKPVGLGQLGFGEGKFAPELSRLQYQAPAERGLRTACEESEKLLERYRRCVMMSCGE